MMREEDRIMIEFFNAYNIIANLHRLKHKTMLLARNRDVINHLDNLNIIINYLKKDIGKHKQSQAQNNISEHVEKNLVKTNTHLG